jgi:hypothetical protein
MPNTTATMDVSLSCVIALKSFIQTRPQHHPRHLTGYTVMPLTAAWVTDAAGAQAIDEPRLPNLEFYSAVNLRPRA